jgi:hypothetical protein
MINDEGRTGYILSPFGSQFPTYGDSRSDCRPFGCRSRVSKRINKERDIRRSNRERERERDTADTGLASPSSCKASVL